MSESDKQQKGHIEFRKAGERRFYAPDRDLLHIYPIAVKSAFKNTSDVCDNQVFNTQFMPLVKAIAGIHNKAVTTEDSAVDIIKTTLDDCKINKECYAIFTEQFLKAIAALYIHALRDAADKPLLTEAELERALRSIGILAMLPIDARMKVEPFIKMSIGDMSRFGDSEGAFVKDVQEPGATS